MQELSVLGESREVRLSYTAKYGKAPIVIKNDDTLSVDILFYTLHWKRNVQTYHALVLNSVNKVDGSAEICSIRHLTFYQKFFEPISNFWLTQQNQRFTIKSLLYSLLLAEIDNLLLEVFAKNLPKIIEGQDNKNVSFKYILEGINEAVFPASSYPERVLGKMFTPVCLEIPPVLIQPGKYIQQGQQLGIANLTNIYSPTGLNIQYTNEANGNAVNLTGLDLSPSGAVVPASPAKTLLIITYIKNRRQLKQIYKSNRGVLVEASKVAVYDIIMQHLTAYSYNQPTFGSAIAMKFTLPKHSSIRFGHSDQLADIRFILQAVPDYTGKSGTVLLKLAGVRNLSQKEGIALTINTNKGEKIEIQAIGNDPFMIGVRDEKKLEFANNLEYEAHIELPENKELIHKTKLPVVGAITTIPTV